jgi:hypothetical protein
MNYKDDINFLNFLINLNVFYLLNLTSFGKQHMASDIVIIE